MNGVLYCAHCLSGGILQPLTEIEGRSFCPSGFLGPGHRYDAEGNELSWEDIQRMVVNLVVASTDNKNLKIAVSLALHGRSNHAH